MKIEEAAEQTKRSTDHLAKRCYYEITNFKLLKINSMLWRVSDDYLELESILSISSVEPLSSGCWSCLMVWTSAGQPVWKWKKPFLLSVLLQITWLSGNSSFSKANKAKWWQRLYGPLVRVRRRRQQGTSAGFQRKTAIQREWLALHLRVGLRGSWIARVDIMSVFLLFMSKRERELCLNICFVPELRITSV